MIQFWSGRKQYKIDKGDRVMDNGNCIQFLPLDDTKRPAKRSGLMSWRQSVYIGVGDWQRIKPLLKLTHEDNIAKTYTYL